MATGKNVPNTNFIAFQEGLVTLLLNNLKIYSIAVGGCILFGFRII